MAFFIWNIMCIYSRSLCRKHSASVAGNVKCYGGYWNYITNTLNEPLPCTRHWREICWAEVSSNHKVWCPQVRRPATLFKRHRRLFNGRSQVTGALLLWHDRDLLGSRALLRDLHDAHRVGETGALTPPGHDDNQVVSLDNLHTQTDIIIWHHQTSPSARRPATNRQTSIITVTQHVHRSKTVVPC